ncbi:hypothetical protein [Streptomyces sp. NPDC046261]|uniref:hypothetical protein n=1 Tax=Streptomyces sp. NPDC046261 TaxID=3157200 RepID=UPI00340189C7
MALRTSAAMVFAATALAGSLIGTSGTASAAGTADFGAQAKKAGLSGAQAKELQSRVDDYLARGGGRQVAANKIELDGASLTLALPGEKKARDLSSANAKFAECRYERFCMFRGQNFTGDQLDLYYCKDHALSNWRGYGSWLNNQTPGTQARLKDRNRNVVTTTVGAPSYNPSYYWEPIWYVRPC